MLPTVIDGCWGACIPAIACTAVDDCSACPEETVCLAYEAVEPQLTCVPAARDCPDPPVCNCLEHDACSLWSDHACFNGEDGPYCAHHGWD